MEPLLPCLLLVLPLLSSFSLAAAETFPGAVQLPHQATSTSLGTSGEDDIILNPRFEDGLSNWSAKACEIELHQSLGDGKIIPLSGKLFASATNRTESWSGIQQEITGRVLREVAYQVTAVVRIYSDNVTSAGVQLTLWVQESDLREEYIAIANSQVTDHDWLELTGEFLLNTSPSRAIIYLEGPPAGTNILVNYVIAKHAQKMPSSARPVPKNSPLGANIVENSNLDDATNGWFPLGNCNLSVGSGSPTLLPQMARESLGPHESLSGRYIIATNRSDSWMGPAQMITDKLKLYITYQVSAWVRIGATGPQIVNVAFGVDGQWVNAGGVESSNDKWYEIAGSFRVEKQPSNVMVYVQGPAAGVDLMVAGLQIFPVNRQARFKYLKQQTDKIRKRDVILKFSTSGNSTMLGNSVQVTQLQNSFPFGSCITRSNIDNEEFVKFFVKNFNWAVFGNELKWSWIEPQQGKFNYKDADELLDFCQGHNIPVRGHAIFWEEEYAIQSWVRSLNGIDLINAIQKHITDILTRYKGKFRHYDVDNEMLHGSFYRDRLGKNIQVYMFEAAHQLDPSATLFVNDYHIEDGSDVRSTPEKYVKQVLDVQALGAPVMGIGIQGHIDVPVGPIVGSALDKIGVLGLPIWITELDVSSANEYIRADDLEVMLREAFGHPAVEGVILWGFWELYMSRRDAYLVNTEGKVSEAGKRFLALKKEWLTYANGHINEQGEFKFRGFHGSYNIEIMTPSGKVNKTFVVDRGDLPLVLSLDL